MAAPRWVVSLIGALFLSGGGFMLGLLLGVVSEEPDLVVRHLAGSGEQVPWTPDAEPGLSEPARRADPEASGTVVPEPAEPLGARTRNVPIVAAAPPSPKSPSKTVPARVAAAKKPVERAPARKAVTARPRQTAVPPSVRKGFAVQVGAFSGSDVAKGLAARLRSKGFDAYVTPSAGPQDGRWRVRVGPVASKEAAQTVANKLESQEQLPTWVLSEEGR